MMISSNSVAKYSGASLTQAAAAGNALSNVASNSNIESMFEKQGDSLTILDIRIDELDFKIDRLIREVKDILTVLHEFNAIPGSRGNVTQSHV